MTPFIPALLAKLTLILMLGIIVTATLRSFGPSLRHLVLFATIASGLALPFVMLMSPQWNVPVLPQSSSTLLSSAIGLASGVTVDHRQSNPFADSRLVKGTTNAPTSNSALTAKVIDAGAATTAADRRRLLSDLPLIPLIWLLGVVAVIGWLAIGRIRLRRIAATSWPLDDSDWRRILDEERRDAGVTQPVLLYSSSVVSTPLTWGSRAPVILVPEDAVDWSEAHRRIVLRHELAHVARGDSFSQLVAGLVCALYWFHPLVWVAERRLRAECERACDDNVVSLGTPAAEYAAHLLEVARSARAFGAPGFLSVAMARPSQLEGRLLAVLNESRRRVSLSRAARPAAALLSALVLIPLAAFRPVPKADKPPSDRVAPSTSTSTSPSTSTSKGSTERFKSPRPAPAAAAPSIHSAKVAPATEPATTTSVAWTTNTASASSPLSSSAASSNVATPALGKQADTTFQLSVPARSAGTLSLDLKTGGNVTITGWDRAEVAVRASLGGRDWRATEVSLTPSDAGARLKSDYTERGVSRSSRHTFQINVPRNYSVRLSSAGGSLSITGVDGVFTGETGGGEINIQKANGEVDIRTGGGEVHVSDSRLNGNVSTGGGIVRIERVSGDLNGKSGSGPVIYSHSGSGSGGGSGSGTGSGTTTTTYSYRSGLHSRGFGASEIRMNSAGGGISLPAAPDGAEVTTGGGPIRIGPSGGEVYAWTGGGPIDIGPATGSVEAHTGGGDVTIELRGAGAHSVDVSSGRGQVTLVLPRDLNATLDLETAYTNNFGHKTRIVSDVPLQTTETANWDDSQGTPRRYVRARQTVASGTGGGVIRVRTVNGDIVLKRR